MRDHFGIKLNFYNKDADAKLIVTYSFDCKETFEGAANDEESKGGEQHQMSRKLGDSKNLANQFMQKSANQEGMKPMEFSVLYLI